eukprot:scaffold3823_cov195-Amphora_coffeaeformis.AAC.3
MLGSRLVLLLLLVAVAVFGSSSFVRRWRACRLLVQIRPMCGGWHVVVGLVTGSGGKGAESVKKVWYSFQWSIVTGQCRSYFVESPCRVHCSIVVNVAIILCSRTMSHHHCCERSPFCRLVLA